MYICYPCRERNQFKLKWSCFIFVYDFVSSIWSCELFAQFKFRSLAFPRKPVLGGRIHLLSDNGQSEWNLVSFVLNIVWTRTTLGNASFETGMVYDVNWYYIARRFKICAQLRHTITYMCWAQLVNINSSHYPVPSHLILILQIPMGNVFEADSNLYQFPHTPVL